MGMETMAEVRRYAVGIQLKIMALAANSADMAGIATLTLEPMNGVKKEANVATNRAVVLFIWFVSILSNHIYLDFVSANLIHPTINYTMNLSRIFLFPFGFNPV
jgi:hypothetical protein